ncbi:methyltransferase domain-containing protein [Candidatus Gottesmanbacteria bacterium]|nr:methyltransferase domain-containing protein [Candidatus Gottesmanbacteria bacterium]
MSFVSYIIPQTIARFSTKYNHDIRVIEESGKFKLLVNGSRQSGKYIEWLWKRAFHAFRLPPCQSILVLGVGGGTVIHLLHKRYPDANITAVDIDPKMIEIGKKYFGLSRVSNVELIIANAKNYKITHEYDLIIVDLFLGRHIPDFVSSQSFLKQLRSKVVIINYLRELEYKEKSQKLEDLLETIFPVVKNYQIAHNSFYFVVK